MLRECQEEGMRFTVIVLVCVWGALNCLIIGIVLWAVRHGMATAKAQRLVWLLAGSGCLYYAYRLLLSAIQSWPLAS
jgi:hypothetical protein